MKPGPEPWVVNVKVSEEEPTYCLATALGTREVVTAGHCLFNREKFLMRAKEEVEILTVAEDGSTRAFQVDAISLHPEFDFFNASFNVALLHLAEDLEGVGEGVSDLCLPEDASSTFEGQVGSVAGYALDDKGNRIDPETPTKTQMSILPPSCEGKLIDCWEITSHMLCAVMDGGDACLDNAGGPLTVRDGERHVLVGISSFGRDCKDPRTPKVYVRVSEFLSWISEQVGDISLCKRNR